MGFNITLPNITATNPSEQIKQLHSYLFQITEQLNWALSTLEKSTTEGTVSDLVQASSSGALTETEAQNSFNSIKSLIIKSADIVDAYYEEINEKFVGNYVAQSDFGTYVGDTEKTISKNSKATEENYKNLQRIIPKVDDIDTYLIDVKANIKTGLLYYDDNGVPIYGLEIGQTNEIDGVETFNKFARFTADRLSFYDSNGIEVAYISDKKLYITHVEISGSFKRGGLIDIVQADKSIVTKYIR